MKEAHLGLKQQLIKISTMCIWNQSISPQPKSQEIEILKPIIMDTSYNKLYFFFFHSINQVDKDATLASEHHPTIVVYTQQFSFGYFTSSSWSKIT